MNNFLLLAAGVISVLFARPVSAGGPDFRRASWGMTQAEVVATETDRPAAVSQSNGEAIVKYEPVSAGEMGGRLIYIFANDKLVRAKYVSNAEHDEPNDFIVDFRAIEPVLMEKYGKP